MSSGLSPRSVPPPASDRVPFGKSAAILLGVLGLFGLAVGASQYLRQGWEQGRPLERRLPSNLGRSEIHLVNQQLFEQASQAQLPPQSAQRREAQRVRLNGYGWTSRERGLIHVPLSVAIDALLAEENEEAK